MQLSFRPHAGLPFALDGPGGDLAGARRRAGLTRALFEAPEALEVIKARVTARLGLDAADGPSSLARLLPLAHACGVLGRDGAGRHHVASPQARVYLMGGWLEEFMAMILIEAECEEVRFSQKVIWRASADGSLHGNEIDAMGLSNGRLVLVSCKAMAHDSLSRSNGDDRLFEALMELSYWKDHFGKGEALAILATTADFYDEAQRRFRSPKLVERARVMDLAVLPADLGSHDRCLAHLRQLLDQD